MSMNTPVHGIADTRPQQRPVFGIALYILAVFMIVVMNAFAKKAMDYHAPIEAVFYRGVIAMSLLLVYAACKRRLIDIYRTQRLKSHLGRAVAGNIGVIMVFWSYSLMPLADVTAMLFAAPLIVTILSALLLKEAVGPYRWLAVCVGFVGVLLIVQPSGEKYTSYGPLVVMVAVFATSLVQIFLRDLGKTEDALTTIFYFLLFGLVVTGIYMIFKGTWPHPLALMPLLGAGVASGIQLLAKTEAFRMAEASLLSPFSYTSIVWATLLGWVFWDDLPTLTVIFGTAVVIASNLFILWREKKRGRTHCQSD